ncbi:calcium-dependent phosphotriesterase [Lojkania enalia]|uniref:Calcium-dependent phosphotriesterase n=1 Tax=Lojkania enalia TaxID=147567 RepID=A0A9P4KCY0_9PLEO|nr:calcium-dependent phosphotriesterase [Didymosphaeria enalia]
MSSIISVDLLVAATSPLYFSNLVATNVPNPNTISLFPYHPNFTNNILGPSSTARQLHNLANGGTNWFPPGSEQGNGKTPPRLLFYDEGDFNSYSSLLSVDPVTRESEVILSSYYGRNFSSNFRPEPTIPSLVYRFSPFTSELVVVADGFDQSNGLEFSPDLKTLYVTDTRQAQFNNYLTRPSTIYAFDVVGGKSSENRRTLAYVDTGFPDRIHTDVEGNVWAACGDGVHIWGSDGTFLVLIFSNAQLWIVEEIGAVGREICNDFELC